MDIYSCSIQWGNDAKILSHLFNIYVKVWKDIYQYLNNDVIIINLTFLLYLGGISNICYNKCYFYN